MPLCRHCNERHVNAARGMCSRCYFDPVIRAMYPSRMNFQKQHRSSTETMTMAELDAIIAEQLPTMPGFDPHEDAMDRKRDRLRRMK
jgi:hypothetical protein